MTNSNIPAVPEPSIRAATESDDVFDIATVIKIKNGHTIKMFFKNAFKTKKPFQMKNTFSTNKNNNNFKFKTTFYYGSSVMITFVGLSYFYHVFIYF